jgi:hypothetical protein
MNISICIYKFCWFDGSNTTKWSSYLYSSFSSFLTFVNTHIFQKDKIKKWLFNKAMFFVLKMKKLSQNEWILLCWICWEMIQIFIIILIEMDDPYFWLTLFRWFLVISLSYFQNHLNWIMNLHNYPLIHKRNIFKIWLLCSILMLKCLIWDVLLILLNIFEWFMNVDFVLFFLIMILKIVFNFEFNWWTLLILFEKLVSDFWDKYLF